MRSILDARRKFMEAVGIATVDETALVSFFLGYTEETLDKITHARTGHLSLFEFIYEECRKGISPHELEAMDMLDVLMD